VATSESDARDARDDEDARDGATGGTSEPGAPGADVDDGHADDRDAPDEGDGVDAVADADVDPVIEARDVVREYESGQRTLRALAGVDVAVEPGEFVSVVGPSGSGKSTLLNVLGLLDTPTTGTVELRGTDVETLSTRERTDARRSTVGFVFQSFYLVPTLSALENVMVPRLLAGSTRATRERAADLLRRVGLGDRLDHRPGELSGGQKQRVAVARALINEPDLVLADEPTGNLDRETGATVLAEFEAVADEGVAVVAVTHDEQVAAHTDRVVRLVDGRLDPDAEVL
jgi:putative ABC transport system ATP-binding protein